MTFTFFRAVALVAALASLVACGDNAPKSTAAPAPQISPSSAQLPVPIPAPQPQLPKLDYASLSAAVEALRPHMSDKFDTPSDGALLLTFWARNNMKWAELQSQPQSKYALVMKDADTQRGKRLCASGAIVEIAADSSAGNPKIYTGGIMDDSGRFYRFYAVKSTGELVANSRATFCGIVIGRYDYSNSIGGVAHSVQLVGMFDLAENKR